MRGKKMAQRESMKPTKYERSYKILEYLMRNSDEQHTVSQADLRKVPELEPYMGNKETSNDTIVNMAMAMNFDEDGVKPEEEWKIVFQEFKKKYHNKIDEDEIEYDEIDDLNESVPRMPIRGLYYRHTFSYDEINSLIESVLFSKTLDTQTAHTLMDKIENNLTTKFYRRGAKRICKIQEPVLQDKERMRENLLTIQQAIDDHVKISFRFNGYNWKKELQPVRDKKDVVSPYYIVANGGRYYLLACMKRNMSIWRIDLMTEIEIPERNEQKGKKGIPVLRKQEVENLPMEWSEDFQLSHLNMAFDEPVWIKLKIKSPKREDDPTKRERVDYTFMHDWFGDTFQFVETEREVPYDDIVRVKCSPYAMVNWALQYSDRVEVLTPVSVREAVIEKIRNLNEKYNIGS
jgi:predicted DNA-binding transcriptional regulator YafY